MTLIAYNSERNPLAPATTAAPTSTTRVMDSRSLDRSLASGLGWSAGAKWTTQIVSWASLVIVTRLLPPSDFGLIGMAVMYLGVLQIVPDAFGVAVTALRHLTDEELAQLNTFVLILGFLACLLSCGIAIPLGYFFRSPHLPLVVVVMSTMFPVSALGTLPSSLLCRDMRIKLLSILGAIQMLVQALTMLVLVWLGFGYWALVLSNIVGTATLAALQISKLPCRFAWPKFSAMKSTLTFSRHIMVSKLSWYVYTDADFLVAGRMLGQAALGAYSLAWTLATIPLEKVTTIVSNTSFPYFSAAQNDCVALRRYLRILTEGLSIITFPLTIGMSLVASDLVNVVLGAKWQAAIVPLTILAFYGSFRSITTLLPVILNVTGETRFVMRNTQAALILMPAAFYVGSHWGAAGIAYGWVLAYPFIAIVLYWKTFQKIKMPWREYLGGIRPALNSCLIMAAAVESLKFCLTSSFPLAVRLGLEVAGGGAAYAIALAVLHRDRLFVFWDFVKGLRMPSG